MKRFYDSLAEGKIMGFRCKKCGAYIFPPYPICQSCGKRDLEWAELSGEAKVLNLGSSPIPSPVFQDYAPYAYGLVKFKEGPTFMTMISGIDVSSPSKISEAVDKLPIDVRAEIKKFAGLAILTFKCA